MTPEQEAAYALDWHLPRDGLEPAVQLEYDRLKMQRELLPQRRPVAPRETKTRAWPYLIPVAVLCVAWMIWGIGGVTILGSHMNFKTLRSDISKIQLPAGFEEVSSSESGRDCAKRPCALREFWVWRGSRTNTAIDACRDVRRAMGAHLPQVEPNDPMPHGTACSYFDILGAFLRPDLGKRSVQAFVWVNSKAKGSPGGYMVELIAAYNYLGY
jgi:hypothetical protein